MKKSFTYCLLSILVAASLGCQTTTEERFVKYEPYEFEKSEPYVLDTTGMEFPDEPTVIYGRYNFKTGNMEIVDETDNPTHILFTPDDALKIGQIISLADAYRDISKEQERLINTYISQNNALKELVDIEREKANAYRDLFLAADEAYMKERKSRRWDKIFHRGEMLLMTAGMVAVLAVAL